MPSLKPVKKENLSVKVYNEIRNALINGQYEPCLLYTSRCV